jgi:hypothetical protein
MGVIRVLSKYETIWGEEKITARAEESCATS